MKEKTVHVVFKTHLDMGFTDYAANVVKNYFENYIPAALGLAKKSRDGGSRFVWTTGSWLIHQYLEKSSSSARKEMEEAIEAGDISWHALPFTFHSELMDSSLFKAGLGLSQGLDRRFGRKTIAAKMTDVPGHCRSLIPLLAEAGVRFLHIGVNPASTTLELPPVFNWRAPGGEEVTVNYVSGYGQPLEIAGAADYLLFAHSGDNCGPPTPEQLDREFQKLRQNYPGFKIKGSTMDAFASTLAPFVGDFPVITGEMGDTWIHGVGTDPLKTARFKALCRLRRSWEEKGLPPKEPGFQGFTENLLMIPEHTWGMDEKTHLRDYTNYQKEDFQQARQRDQVPQDAAAEQRGFSAFKLNPLDRGSETKEEPPSSYRRFEKSWAEQRGYIDAAVRCLQNEELKKEALLALSQTAPRPVEQERLLKDGFAPFTPEKEMELGPFSLSFSTTTGAVRGMKHRESGISLSAPSGEMALFQYEIFSGENYRIFHERYNINKEWTRGWAVPDFTKPGMEKVPSLSHQFYQPANCRFFSRSTGRGSQKKQEIAALMEMPADCVERYAAPKNVQIIYGFTEEPLMEMELRWSSKTAGRIAEAVWLSFFPSCSPTARWSINKMGREISPFEVIPGGNRALHGTERGISCQDKKNLLQLEPLDTPLVSPGRPRILEFDQAQPDMREGVHFNLYNNLWGTNFPMWYEDDALARFRLGFRQGS